MEANGLLTGRRDSDNRRVQVVELTAKGEAAFNRLWVAAVEFDRRLRVGLSESDVTRLAELLAQLRANLAGALEPKPKRR
jgi:MarR family transcriptional regulator for hemolysin